MTETDGAESPRRPQQRPAKSEKTPIFRLLAFLVVPFMSMVARYRIQDGDKVPKSGAFILAPNHYSEIDPLVVGVVMWKLGRMPHFMAKASIFKIPVLGYLAKISGQIPVERAGMARGSDPLAAATRIVDQGLAVVIYPEGSLTRDPELWPMRGKTGAVRMALEADIPLIPLSHWGSQKVMPRYGKKLSLFPRKTIDVRVGDPVDLSEFRGRPLDTSTLTAATHKVMVSITALTAELRGENPPPKPWDPAKNNQKETGRF
ncbi:MAG: lysophospholipid acyltransferase family protein [Homoserinimonas sp.]